VVARLEFPLADLLRLPELRQEIRPAPGLAAALLPFDDWRVQVLPLDEPSAALLDLLPEGRSVRFDAALHRLERRCGADAFLAAVVRLAEIGLVGIYGK